MRRWMPLLLAVAMIALVAADASACPTCKEAVANDNPGGAQGAFAGDAAGGFNHAIYFALASVFSIIGVLGWRVYRAVTRGPSA